MRADIKELGFTAARTALQVPGALRAAYDNASSAAVSAFSETLQEGGNGPSTRS